jgi:hypothetical protein
MRMALLFRSATCHGYRAKLARQYSVERRTASGKTDGTG